MAQKVTFVSQYNRLKNISYIEDEDGKLHKFTQFFEDGAYETRNALEIKAMRQDPHLNKTYREKK